MNNRHIIESLEDPRLDPYRHLRTKNLTRYSQRFIAESRPLVERLLASEYQVESILVDLDYANEIDSWIPKSIPVYLVDPSWIDQLLGFQFHRGFLACGIRSRQPSYEEVLARASDDSNWTGVYAVGIQDPENLGVLIRNCAALGIRDCFLGPGTADPLSRRVLRVSMGTAFRIHLIDSIQTEPVLSRATELGIQTMATSLQEPSMPIQSFRRDGPLLVLFGNEAHGLPLDLQKRANHRLQITMASGVDSLNVAVASGIVLHYLTRLQCNGALMSG